MQSGSYEPTSGDAPAKGSKDNPYTWDEYCTMLDSTEPLSSSFYFRNEDDEMRFSMADVVIKYDGGSDYSGESDYDGSSNYGEDFDFDGISDYHCSSGIYNLSNPMDALSCMMTLYDKYADAISSQLVNISQFFGAIGAFPTAFVNYYTGDPVDLTYDINNLGLNCLSEEIFTKYNGNKKVEVGQAVYINLLKPDALTVAICNAKSAYDIACYASTALAIGGITFTKVGTHQYQIKHHDTYNFDLKEGREYLIRNIETVLGKIVNEGFSIGADRLMLGPLGVIMGLIRRNVTGTTSFQIKFSGTLTVY